MTDEADDHARAGEVFAGRYTIIEHIADGAMASVYRASDERESLRVAIKVPGPTADDRSRFVREAEVLSKISHPNVVSVRDVQLDHSPPF